MKHREKSEKTSQLFEQELSVLLDQRQGLYQLANHLPWEEFEEAFSGDHSEIGRPAKRWWVCCC